LFHAGPALGVVPFKAFFLSCSRTPFPAPHTLRPLVNCRTVRLASRSAVMNLGSYGAQYTRRDGQWMATFPDYRVLLHTKVRHGHRWFRPKHARGSLGLLPLQGVLSRTDTWLSPRNPLTRFTHLGPKDQDRSATGYRSKRDWLVSLETADPPGVFYLVKHHKRSTWTWPGSHLLGHRGSSPNP
jgi:hypothetical protein